MVLICPFDENSQLPELFSHYYVVGIVVPLTRYHRGRRAVEGVVNPTVKKARENIFFNTPEVQHWSPLLVIQTLSKGKLTIPPSLEPYIVYVSPILTEKAHGTGQGCIALVNLLHLGEIAISFPPQKLFAPEFFLLKA